MEADVSKIGVHIRRSDSRHDILFDGLAQVSSHMVRAGLTRGRCLIVTDENVGPLYAGLVERALEADGWRSLRITLPAGERTKSIDHLSSVVDAALAFGVDRSSPVIALGGGVVGDVAGFAASIILRGLPLVQLPTSLIAQVDSAIGGKTGVNHAAGKNLVGSFHQPSLVLVDSAALQTLPEPDWMGALSEVVKYALIRDPSFLAVLLGSWQDILERKPDVVRSLVARCVQIKVDIVQEDELESGIRAHLNFGHTFGHALEKVAAYRGVTHGVAVAVGMRAATSLSAARSPAEDFSSAFDVLDRLPHLPGADSFDISALTQAMQMDKKRVGAGLRFVLLERIGAAAVVSDVSDAEVADAWRSALDLSNRG